MKDPVNIKPNQLVSTTKLLRSFGPTLEKAKKEGPLFITRDQEVEFVLLTLEDYRKLLG